MKNDVTPSKSYLVFGLFFGLLMILSFVLIYVSGINLVENRTVGTTSSIVNYFLLPVILIYLGCENFKKNNGGLISFVECLKVGVSIAFVGALILSIFNVIFNLLFPEYIEEILSQTRQIMIQSNPNLTSEQIESGINMTRKFSAPLFSVPITLLMFSFLGLIYSLIIGLIVKKEHPQSF